MKKLLFTFLTLACFVLAQHIALFHQYESDPHHADHPACATCDLANHLGGMDMPAPAVAIPVFPAPRFTFKPTSAFFTSASAHNYFSRAPPDFKFDNNI